MRPSSGLKPWEAPEEAASQGRFSRANSSRGSHHSPSGRVNSRKVGSDTTVWEMVCTGSSMQVTSLGRQDLMQRTVSVFSWRSLRGTTAQEEDGKVGTATPTETHVPGGAAGGPAGSACPRDGPTREAQRPPQPSCSLGMPHSPSCQLDQDPHSGPHLPWLWISEALLFAKLHGLSFGFHNCRRIHPLDKCVLKACWVRGTRDAEANMGDVVPLPRSPPVRWVAGVVSERPRR